MAEFSLSSIRHEIESQNLGWQAGLTSLADLSRQEQDAHLGLHLDKDQIRRLHRAFEAVTCEPCSFPPGWNWQDVDGIDWTTPIRDQGACGSCVAFGVLGAVETMVKWTGGDASRKVDLSEAHLFFCGCGRCCQTGWWPGEALDYLRDQGVPDEACFPYQARDMACRDTCADWASRAVRVGPWHEILDAAARKQWLSTIGPLVGAMAVYRDFFYYTGGVYRPATNDLAGYHAVAVVGYDEGQSAWICKNSWGLGWGDAGWFRLAYGACRIDTEFPAWAIESVVVPNGSEPAPEPKGCSPLAWLRARLPRG
jgi:C1A family cysteine protease